MNDSKIRQINVLHIISVTEQMTVKHDHNVGGDFRLWVWIREFVTNTVRYKNIAYILHSTAYFKVWLKNNLLTCEKPLSTVLSGILEPIFNFCLSLKLLVEEIVFR